LHALVEQQQSSFQGISESIAFRASFLYLQKNKDVLHRTQSPQLPGPGILALACVTAFHALSSTRAWWSL
jgi:hypothetical protein